jgi:hypothetical protein
MERQLAENTRNELSGLVLPGHKGYLSHLVDLKKRRGAGPIPYFFDDFGHELGAHVLRKGDADVVMGFLGDLAREVGTHELEIVLEGGGGEDERTTVYARLRGENLPNTALSVELYFITAPWQGKPEVTRSVRVFTEGMNFNPEQYHNSDEYEAWGRALSQINRNSYRNVAKKTDGGRIYFETYANTNPNPGPFGGVVTLNEIFDRTVSCARAVEHAYLATKEFQAIRDTHIGDLAARILAVIPGPAEGKAAG